MKKFFSVAIILLSLSTAAFAQATDDQPNTTAQTAQQPQTDMFAGLTVCPSIHTIMWNYGQVHGGVLSCPVQRRKTLGGGYHYELTNRALDIRVNVADNSPAGYSPYVVSFYLKRDPTMSPATAYDLFVREQSGAWSDPDAQGVETFQYAAGVFVPVTFKSQTIDRQNGTTERGWIFGSQKIKEAISYTQSTN